MNKTFNDILYIEIGGKKFYEKQKNYYYFSCSWAISNSFVNSNVNNNKGCIL